MNDHTWLPHDLPDYTATPLNPPPTYRWRVQLFKGAWGWSWTHQCTTVTHAEMYGVPWGEALRAACEHMRGHG